MVLGDVEESVTIREIDEETEEEIVKVYFPCLFPTFVTNIHNHRHPNGQLTCYL